MGGLCFGRLRTAFRAAVARARFASLFRFQPRRVPAAVDLTGGGGHERSGTGCRREAAHITTRAGGGPTGRFESWSCGAADGALAPLSGHVNVG